MIETSDGYVRLIVAALAWRTPPTQECAGLRTRIESMAIPFASRDLDAVTAKPQALLEIYQRMEENTMARHSSFSREVYEAVRQDCLLVPVAASAAVEPAEKPQN